MREKSDQVYKVEINQHVRQGKATTRCRSRRQSTRQHAKNEVALIVRKKWVAGDKIHHPSTFDHAQYNLCS